MIVQHKVRLALPSEAKPIAEMSREYQRAEESSFRPFYEKWPDVLESFMRG